jgi:MarR family transcriptional regulator for hemolysin
MPMPTPSHPPIGPKLTRTARVAAQSFDRALAEAGGSAAVWQVLLAIRSGQWGQQSEMAAAMGVTSATLTHHLNALERNGLVRRWREASNRRVQRAELTDAGAALFDRLREVAARHDSRLRAGFTAEELATLSALLDRMRELVETGPAEPAAAGPA